MEVADEIVHETLRARVLAMHRYLVHHCGHGLQRFTEFRGAIELQLLQREQRQCRVESVTCEGWGEQEQEEGGAVQ